MPVLPALRDHKSQHAKLLLGKGYEKDQHATLCEGGGTLYRGGPLVASPRQLQFADRIHFCFRLWDLGPRICVASSLWRHPPATTWVRRFRSPPWSSRAPSCSRLPLTWEQREKRWDDGPLHYSQPARASAVQVHRHRPRGHHEVGMAGEPAPRLLLLLHGPLRSSQLLRHCREWEQSASPLQLDGEDAAALRPTSRQAGGELRPRRITAVREYLSLSSPGLPAFSLVLKWTDSQCFCFSCFPCTEVLTQGVPHDLPSCGPCFPDPVFLWNTALGNRQDPWELWLDRGANFRGDGTGVRRNLEARFRLVDCCFLHKV